MNIYELLDKLNIKYDLVTHIPIYTVEDGRKIDRNIQGIGCKNLFLKTHKNEFFLVVLEKDKQIKLNDLRKYLKVSNLHFAEDNYLKELLQVIPGSVTPLGIINDINNKVTIVIDKDLIDKKILCHPLVNNKTINIEYSDLIKFIEYLKHNYIIY